MAQNSFGSFDAHNPWIGNERSLAPLRNALILAEKSGHIRRRSDYEMNRLHQDMEEKMPSLKLIEVLKETARIQKELNRVNLEIQCRMQDKETSDITHLDILESRIGRINSLNSHIQSIVNSKDQLINRLQQPFVGDYVKLEAQYHRYASELFPQMAPLMADLTTHLENISWSKSLNFSDGRMETILLELSSSLAALQTNFQSLCQLRQSMNHLYHHEVGD